MNLHSSSPIDFSRSNHYFLYRLGTGIYSLVLGSIIYFTLVAAYISVSVKGSPMFFSVTIFLQQAASQNIASAS